jgi:hypothetical protein
MRRVLFFGAVGGLAAILLNAALEPNIGLANRANQFAVGIAFMVLPIVAAVAGTHITRRIPRILGSVALWIAALCVARFGADTAIRGLWAVGGLEPPTFVSTGRYTLAVYQFGGATSEGGGIVDQVCRIAPGLVYATQIYERDPGDDVVVQVVDKGHVRIDTATVSLRPLFWPFC